MHTLLAQQRRELERSGQMEPQENDHDPADAGDPLLVVAEELPEKARGCAQNDEHDREPDDEEQGVLERPPAVDARLQVLEADAAHERQIAGHERQHARRQEGSAHLR